MNGPWQHIKEFISCESRPTATEYAVALALIIVVAVFAIAMLGSSVTSTYKDVDNDLQPL